MKGTICKLFLCVLLGSLSGLAQADEKMIKLERSEFVPAPGKALVIFMRSSIVAGAYSAPVIDADVKTTVNGESKTEDKLVGILSMYSNVPYQADPGEHVFISAAGSGRIAKATLLEGKTYYILVRPNWGMSPSYSLRPLHADPKAEVRLNHEDLPKWLTSDFKEPTAEGHAWAKENAASITEKKIAVLQLWETLPEDEKAALTLLPTDTK